MEPATKQEQDAALEALLPPPGAASAVAAARAIAKPRSRAKKEKAAEGGKDDKETPSKRRCVSTACIACRKRKSKCDGNTPSCAACASVYGTECIYDPNSDHRRKGVYKKDIDNLKTKNSTLQTLIQAILNSPEDEVPALVRQIRTCESLDDVAENLIAKDRGKDPDEDEDDDSPLYDNNGVATLPTFEKELSGKMGQLHLENGAVRFLGGTSNLIYLGTGGYAEDSESDISDSVQSDDDPITSWTNVTSDPELVLHLLNMYVTWHYNYFTTLSKDLFYRDFFLGRKGVDTSRTVYCSSLLVNAMLALGCHFTSRPSARSNPDDSATAGDHFFKEAKRLIMENEEYAKPKLTTVQAMALMSVREAGCGREAKGWVYSGMSFRMAMDMGLNLDSGDLAANSKLDEAEIDARRITFWGCFLFDKCWSNYLGRQPQLPVNNITTPKFDVFPGEDSTTWSPYTDGGLNETIKQVSRTRAVALRVSALCEISSDLLIFFYHPTATSNPPSKTAELNKLTDLHTRLEAWKKDLPLEMEAKEGALPNVLVMHMFYHLLYIHLYRPFLKYTQATSPLPAHVSPRRLCTQAASMISKLLRIYKRTYGLRQIINLAVYIAHSACTIHLLNLPEKNAKRDIIRGVKQLEEIAEGWLCARRTLSILSALAKVWKIELPEEAASTLARTDAKWGSFATAVVSGPARSGNISPKHVPVTVTGPSQPAVATQLQPYQPFYDASVPPQSGFYQVTNPSPIAPISQGVSTLQSTVRTERPSSTGNLPLPPQSAAEFYPTNVSSGHPSPAQPSQGTQHAYWPNTTPGTTSGGRTSTQSQRSPASMFGGDVGAAGVEEPQEWWFKDQNSLAMGFDNWGGFEETYPGGGWSGDVTWAPNGPPNRPQYAGTNTGATGFTAEGTSATYPSGNGQNGIYQAGPNGNSFQEWYQ